jgi:hypothetical protein
MDGNLSKKRGKILSSKISAEMEIHKIDSWLTVPPLAESVKTQQTPKLRQEMFDLGLMHFHASNTFPAVIKGRSFKIGVEA